MNSPPPLPKRKEETNKRTYAPLLICCGTGGLGDYGGLRKTMLGVTGMLGASFSCLIFFLWDFEAYVYGALLMVASNVFFGLSIVYYNASLPALVRAHPKYAAAAALPNREKIASDVADSISVSVRARVHEGWCGWWCVG